MYVPLAVPALRLTTDGGDENIKFAASQTPSRRAAHTSGRRLHGFRVSTHVPKLPIYCRKYRGFATTTPGREAIATFNCCATFSASSL